MRSASAVFLRALAGCYRGLMDAPTTPEPNPETAIEHAEPKDGSITFTVIMMLIAVACVAITAAIAFHDMAAGG